jgi:aminomethyltransferase
LAGLGARDTLRLEARLPLYGHELTEELSPLEAGLAMFVKLDLHDFMGKAVLAAQKEQGVKKALVGLELASRSIARAGMNVMVDGQVIGFVSSGTFSPTLEKSIALAFVDPDYRTVGQQLHIEVRGNQVPASVVKTPFYRRKKEDQ